MGKRILILMLMLGVVGVLFADSLTEQQHGVMLYPDNSTVSWWGTDTPQPDTIRYDDYGTQNYYWALGTYYASTRFTPCDTFDLRAVYLRANGNNLTNLYNVWVTGDVMVGALHTPDPNNILLTESNIAQTTGWIQIDLSDTLTFDPGEHFHVVIGPMPSISAGNWWQVLIDGTPDAFGRSLYTMSWPTGSDFDVVLNHDWRLRAGGEYAVGCPDLAIVNVDNDSLKYFHCLGDVVTFRALVDNLGGFDADTFDVQWEVADTSGAVVFTTIGTYYGLLMGNSTTVVAPTSWTTAAVDEYIVTCTNLWPDDTVPDNDTKMLEQQVYDPTASAMLNYTLPPYNVSVTTDPGDGYAMQYVACQYPLQVTHIEVETADAGTVSMRVLGDDGLDDPSGVLFDTTITLVAGSTVIPIVPAVTIADGPFYVAYVNTGTASLSLYLDEDPNAGSNVTMPVKWQTYDSGVTWSQATGPDSPLNARVMPYGGVIRDIRVDWMTFPGFFGPGSDPFDGQIQVSNQGTQADTFDVSLTIEDTTFTRSVVFYESQQVIDLAPGDSAELTYSTYNFPNIGEYILTAEAVAPGDVTPGDNVIMAEHQTCSYPSELTYDDGTFENGWAYYDPGNWWGAYFDPPFHPCRITGMRLNFSTVPAGYDNARVQIIADDQTTLLFDMEDESVDEGWNTYVVPDVPIASSYFYAGTEWVTGAPDAPYFGTDSNEPISYMARQRVTGVWYYDVEEAGVRVTVDGPKMSPVVITRTGGSRNLDMQLTWNHIGTSETYYFIYESDTPYGTYTLVDSVLYPAQSWSDTNLPEMKKFYYVTFGDASGARDQTLPGQYLWQPFEISPSRINGIEPGVTRLVPDGVADRR